MILRGKDKRIRKKTLPQCHYVLHKSIPHEQNRARSRTSAVRGRRLADPTIARPWYALCYIFTSWGLTVRCARNISYICAGLQKCGALPALRMALVQRLRKTTINSVTTDNAHRRYHSLTEFCKHVISDRCCLCKYEEELSDLVPGGRVEIRGGQL
jgi:hypothetical protein